MTLAPLEGAAAFPGRAPLEGERFRMVPVDPAHAPALFAESHGPDMGGLWTYMSYGPFPSVGAMTEWLAECASSRDTWFHTVIERDGERPVGMAAYLAVVPAMRRLELGHIWYAPRVQGGGVNAEVALMFLRDAFEVRGYRRVEWKCDARNERSRRAALGLGFSYEGLFRQHMIVKGRNRDTAYFSVLDAEWPSVRERLEARARRVL